MARAAIIGYCDNIFPMDKNYNHYSKNNDRQENYTWTTKYIRDKDGYMQLAVFFFRLPVAGMIIVPFAYMQSNFWEKNFRKLLHN